VSGDGYRVEIVVTGDEVLFGRIQDTNSNWLAGRLAELGARLRRDSVRAQGFPWQVE
jgi:molybdopterin-biosynthesis enzyme MoeA-like protein